VLVHKITERPEKIADIADRKLCHQKKNYGEMFRPTSSYNLRLLDL
jgi:hypothetical protein